VTEVQKIWYNNGHDDILDDEEGHSKYKEWALHQAENGDVELTITNGFSESEDDRRQVFFCRFVCVRSLTLIHFHTL
jgi:hypothetical protein